MGLLRADSSIQYVKGVGAARAAQFAEIGINTVADLLDYLPFRYEADAGECAIEELRPGQTVTIRGDVVRVRGKSWQNRSCTINDGTGELTLRWFNQAYADRSIIVGGTVIATGKVEVFNDELQIVHPRIQTFGRDALMLKRSAGPPKMSGVYRGNQKVKSPAIRRAVQNVLAHPHLPVADTLPPGLAARHKLLSRENAYRVVHVPRDEQEAEQGRRRLAYEEFFLMELAIALRRRKRVLLQKGRKLHVTPEIDARIRARFPFKLTASQDKVIREIARDLQSGRPMTRLLQGDVGSGKTVVALHASLVAIANGSQAAIMAPTEILAQQHVNKIERYLEGSRVRYLLLRGGQAKKQRGEALSAIESGEIDLVVGTQALLEEDVVFHDLAMVTVDEQHKFGVLQRANIRTKGPTPHYLVMTATPIPRTLAMTVFGDLDVSIIAQSPPGRGTITTKVVPRGKWDIVMRYVRARLEAGEQAYVVCPAIGEAEDGSQDGGIEGLRDQGIEGSRDQGIRGSGDQGNERPSRRRVIGPGAVRSEISNMKSQISNLKPKISNLKSQISNQKSMTQDQGRGLRGPGSTIRNPKSKIQNPRLTIHNPQSKIQNPKSNPPAANSASPTLVSAKRTHRRLCDGPWKGLNVTLLHGGMRSAEKKEIMDQFVAGKIHALVATTVVEVGLDVANATVMIVEQADRYGLSQLHQLRGRVGRGGRDSLCVLIRHGRSRKATERLDVMAETTDGFKIAECDLRHRGPGELLGTRQHGLPSLRFGDLIDDFALLELARGDAFEIVAADPSFRRPEHQRLMPALRIMFGKKLALIDAG